MTVGPSSQKRTQIENFFDMRKENLPPCRSCLRECAAVGGAKYGLSLFAFTDMTLRSTYVEGQMPR
jgi:hypothetical protein